MATDASTEYWQSLTEEERRSFRDNNDLFRIDQSAFWDTLAEAEDRWAEYAVRLIRNGAERKFAFYVTHQGSLVQHNLY